MSSPLPSERGLRSDPDADVGPRRSLANIVYMVGTLLGGAGALVSLGGTLTSPDAGMFDVLLWAALAVLLFGAAAHQWWFAGPAEDRSLRIASHLGSTDVSVAVQGSESEIDAIRCLRRTHPGLGLRDACQLVKDHGAERG